MENYEEGVASGVNALRRLHDRVALYESTKLGHCLNMHSGECSRDEVVNC